MVAFGVVRQNLCNMGTASANLANIALDVTSRITVHEPEFLSELLQGSQNLTKPGVHPDCHHGTHVHALVRVRIRCKSLMLRVVRNHTLVATAASRYIIPI